MKKLIVICVLTFCFYLSTFGQVVDSIISFKLTHVDIESVLRLNYCLHYDNQTIKCIEDTFEIHDENITKYYISTLFIENEWYKRKECFYYLDLAKCYKDSIKIYFPIEYFANPSNPYIMDTLYAIEGSSALYIAKEPILSNGQIGEDLIRITKYSDSTIEIYSFKKNFNEFVIEHKVFGFNSNSFELISNKERTINKRKYNRILKSLNRTFYSFKKIKVYPYKRDILFESNIKNKYNFIHGSSKEMKYDNSNIYKFLVALMK